jgi:hypothetical protein
MKKKATSKSKTKAITYKVGSTLVVSKAPASLAVLVGVEMKVEKQNSKDVTFTGRGMLVISRDELKKKVFTFRAPVAKAEKPAASVAQAEAPAANA